VCLNSQPCAIALTDFVLWGVFWFSLKTDNVLVRRSPAGLSDLSAIVLTDFGVSTDKQVATTLAGTLIPPEVLKNPSGSGHRAYDPFRADVFR
jgi:hypothetical protein